MGMSISPISLHAALLVTLATLAACPTVDLGDDPADPGQCRPDPAYFEQTIWPQFLASTDTATYPSCVDQAGCHRREDGRSALRLEVPADGQAVDYNANYTIVTRFLNCGTPDSSSLFTKPLSGVDPHGGGDLFDPGSPSATSFLDWFAQ